MKSKGSLVIGLFTVLLLLGLQMSVYGQAKDGRFANVAGLGSGVRWDVSVANAGMSLTISAPDGRTFRKEFRAGSSPDFALSERSGLPDGVYTYELRLTPLSAGQKKARPSDDESEAIRTSRSHVEPSSLVQSGSFAILNGQVIVAGAIEDSKRATKASTPAPNFPSANTVNRLRNHRFSLGAMPDQVIADDLIVQGSECVGLDCVNNESFSFDTIRLKENNTRISFNDTSTAAGFPTEDWTIRANSSSSGGASFLAFVDRGTSESGDESGTIVFEVDAGAPSNSVKVGSNGKVGFRTATPVLDLHMNTTDTPAVRFEQNNSGGFTAQTWDIGANEANFFVRDVTGGSRLPFRVRPGAPTSSIDISASGNVGVGTASPSARLEVIPQSVADGVRLTGNTGSSLSPALGLFDSSTARGFVGLAEGAGHFSNDAAVGDIVIRADTGKLLLQTGIAASTLAITSTARVGIGTTAPDQKFSVNGDASKVGGGSWQSFSDERLKNIKGRFTSGLGAVMRLTPLRYEYKPDNVLGLVSEGEHVGFSAQDVQKVIPAAVTKNQNGFLMINNDPILWTMLNAIKEQQNEIVQLKAQIRHLQTTVPHRRVRRSRR